MSVPYISRDAIDEKAEELIGWFDPGRLHEPSLTPVVEIAQRISSEFKVRLVLSQPLGTTQSGGKILGSCHFSTRTIAVDPSLLANTARFNFTLAHELGHLILHRKLRLNYGELDTPVEHIQDD